MEKNILKIMFKYLKILIYIYIYTHYLYNLYASQVVLVVKNPPAICNAGDIRDEVRSLGQEDSLEKGMATHSSIVAWRIP